MKKNTFLIFFLSTLLIVIVYGLLTYFNVFSSELWSNLIIPLVMTPLWCLGLLYLSKSDNKKEQIISFSLMFIARIIVDIILMSINVYLVVLDVLLGFTICWIAAMKEYNKNHPNDPESIAREELFTEVLIKQIGLSKAPPAKYICPKCDIKYAEVGDTCPKCGSKVEEIKEVTKE